jgi:2-methylcitrate dehydratase PrpD
MSETKALASYIVNARSADIPGDVRHEARRALLNIVGCALGGARHPAMDITLRALGPFFGPPTAGVLGRAERVDPLHASLLNGISSHVLDYDDTTPKNYGHHSSPVASALFAYASANVVTGRDLLDAFVLGFETSSRVANAVYPSHYDVGWHMTGTAGVFGAAAAIGRLMALDESAMIHALGLAATQSAGLREMFGSMGKAFHPGRSAQNGYLAAVLAQAGFTSGEQALEGARGFAAVLAATSDLSKITSGLGVDYELRFNTYKPFPCGIVIHPTIDGCIRIHKRDRPAPASISAVRLRVAPLVLDLCNKKEITRGLEGKFSVYHGAAVGLVRGRGGLREFTDEAVGSAVVKRVRDATIAEADAALTEDQASIEVTLTDGRTLTEFVEASLGNLQRPLSDEELEAKCREQAALVLSEPEVDTLLGLLWRTDTLTDAGDLIRAAIPASGHGVSPASHAAV